MKNLVGEYDDTSVKLASIDNLKKSIGAYEGSGVRIAIMDISQKGRTIAKFQISGTEFAKCIPMLITGIKKDLNIRLLLLEAEIKSIKELIGY